MSIKEEIKAVNSSLQFVILDDGNKYYKVSERVRGFREVFPEGEILSTFKPLITEGMWVCETIVKVKDKVLANGIAMLKGIGPGQIESCETVSVGRALAKCGFGVGGSEMASDEERKEAIPKEKKRFREVEATNEPKAETVTELIKLKNDMIAASVGVRKKAFLEDVSKMSGVKIVGYDLVAAIDNEDDMQKVIEACKKILEEGRKY